LLLRGLAFTTVWILDCSIDLLSLEDCLTTLRSQRSADRRRAILRIAMNMASQRGIKGTSLGDLAAEAAATKSTLLLHFGNKEGLALAIVDEVERVFFERVVGPSREAAPGLSRLRLLTERWLGFVPDAFAGGCLFAALAHEFDGQAGVVHDRVGAFAHHLGRVIDGFVDEAHARGELRRGVSGELVLFHLNGIAMALNQGVQMGQRDAAVAHAATAAAWLLRDIVASAPAEARAAVGPGDVRQPGRA
jgi:AcrR family transcriptional regulator